MAKLNATGSALVYSTYLDGGDDGTSQGNAIAVDSSGDAYVTGATTSFDFPTTSGAFQTDNEDGGAFVAKLNATGSALVYSTCLGNNGDSGNGIAVDSAGDAYVTGTTSLNDFPTTAGAFQTVREGFYATAFVTKLNAAGSALIYSTYLGGNGYDQGNGIAVDSAGDAYITGTTGSTDFPITAGAFQTVNGDNDAFVTKLNADGTALVYSTFLGGSGYSQGNGIALDSSGDAWITGSTQSADFPTTSDAVQSDFFENFDAFVSELNADGTALEYSTYLGGADDSDNGNVDSGQAIAVDSAGNIYVTGHASPGNFPIENALQSTQGGGAGDAFIAKFAFGQGQVTTSADTTTLRSSQSSSTLGEMVTFTATVAPASGTTGTPTGTVTFEEGTTVLGTATLGTSGTATFSAATLAVGSNTITAAYSGDANFVTSSGTTVEAVSQAGSTTALAASPNTVTAGQAVTFTATVTPEAGSTATPTGSVTFEEGRAVLGTSALDHGVATFSLASLAVGSNLITAVYSGDANFATASGVTTVTVNAPPATSDGPRLTRVQRFGFHTMPTTVVLTFDQPLDPGSAEDVRNYVILDPSGHRVRINRAVLDATGHTVTLHPAQQISIHQPYQLIVNGAGPGAVSNMSGQPLDSMDAGQPGTSDHVVLTWRQLVLGEVSEAFRIRYGLVPKVPRAKIPSGVSSPKAALGNRAGENGDRGEGGENGDGTGTQMRKMASPSEGAFVKR